jgi:hypothetical protein
MSAANSKYLVMSRNRNAGRSHSIKIDDNSFERVEKFRHLGKNLTNQNSIHKEIKSRLKSGNDAIIRCRILSCTLLAKNLNIKVDGNINVPVVLYVHL